jgi:hypothetical protein
VSCSGALAAGNFVFFMRGTIAATAAMAKVKATLLYQKADCLKQLETRNQKLGTQSPQTRLNIDPSVRFA